MKTGRGFVIGLFLLGALCSFQASPALAVPVIDGIFSAGEWDGLIAQGVDVNDTLITDNWDISSMRVVWEDSGGAGDGLYFLMQTYAAPTFSGGTGSLGDQAWFGFRVDHNGDGDVLDSEDRRINFNDPNFQDQIVRVFAGNSPVQLGTGTGALGDVVEVYVPESLIAGGFNGFGANYFGRLDNAGDEPDDRIQANVVPEPTTMSLLGVGLLGLFGGATRRRMHS